MGTCERCDGLVIAGICTDCMASPGEDATTILPPEFQWPDELPSLAAALLEFEAAI